MAVQAREISFKKPSRIQMISRMISVEVDKAMISDDCMHSSLPSHATHSVVLQQESRRCSAPHSSRDSATIQRKGKPTQFKPRLGMQFPPVCRTKTPLIVRKCHVMHEVLAHMQR